MSADPTAPINFATAFPVPHPIRLRTDLPVYWRLTADDGRSVILVATSMDDAAEWGRQIFPGCWVDGVKLRTAVGTPPF
jgi:hypothetical protein